MKQMSYRPTDALEFINRFPITNERRRDTFFICKLFFHNGELMEFLYQVDRSNIPISHERILSQN